jgi:serine phosphatase RsbU (regulator of sigma subunit)
MYGDTRLRDALQKNAQLDVGRLVERLADEVSRFTDKQSDDVTVVAVRRL